MKNSHTRTIYIAVSPGTRTRVLVAEDNSVIRLATRSLLLSRWKMDLRMVENGAQAAKAAIESEFDLVLMDIEMPVMDGFVATQQIRQFERDNSTRRRTPVVAYSGRPLNAIARQAEESGIDDILAKPSGAQAMCNCLHRWVRGRLSRVSETACDRTEALPPFAAYV